MAITLGKDASPPPFGTGVISATYTEECETVDITNRDNNEGSSGAPGYRQIAAGFTTKTWEIECHDASGLEASLLQSGTGFQILSVTENIKVDGAVTFSVTVKEF